AGAIHAAAIGVHAEHRPAALAFMFLATLQLGWGGLALVRRGRSVVLLGLLVNLAAIGGWVLAKTSGISFIDGLDVAESIQVADGLAAGLAAGSVLVALVALIVAGSSSLLRGPMTIASIGVTGVAMFGMVTGGTHVHASGHEVAAGDHHGASTTGGTAAPHAASTVAPVPYDPSKPIDLGGVEGVTPEQQAAAENLVAVTLLRLPQWSDPAVAEAAGFRSIGDGRTGVEHFVNQAFMSDSTILDPDQPESLVYDTSGGGRRLVAAMYMVEKGLPLEQVPDIGGKLMQWHTHENLCYNAQGKVAGLTDASGNCPAGLVKPVPTPMIHVWIQAHKCGPFAALEGIAGGRIPDGEAKLCDHAHGA
ncbi:MAG: hypothetical protein M3Q68_04670, partial [Actinomycetota bacterium]|nr:hypothetical protein [Actinomycetota bacterium]